MLCFFRVSPIYPGFPELELAETNLDYREIAFAVTRLP